MFISKAGKIIREAGGSLIDNVISEKTLGYMGDAGEAVAAVGVGAAKKASKLTDRMYDLKFDNNASMGFTFKTTGVGKVALGGIIGAGVIAGVTNAEINSWSGMRDNRIYRPTPSYRDYLEEAQMPSYANNASADGSLVFALYKNRLG